MLVARSVGPGVGLGVFTSVSVELLLRVLQGPQELRRWRVPQKPGAADFRAGFFDTPEGQESHREEIAAGGMVRIELDDASAAADQALFWLT